MKRSIAYIPILALVGALILSACAPGAAQPTPSPAPPAVATPTAAEAAQPTPAPEKPVEPVALRIMSGPMGGAWYPLAGAIADIIQNEIPGVTVDVQPGGGILNVEGVNMGKADIGFSNASGAGL